MMKYSSMERYTMKKTQDQGFREYDGIITSGKLMQKAGSPTALLPSRAPPAPSLQCPQHSSWARCYPSGSPSSRSRAGGQSCTHLAVVRRTNKLTMLFSSVLKYCKGKGQTDM